MPDLDSKIRIWGKFPKWLKGIIILTFLASLSLFIVLLLFDKEGDEALLNYFQKNASIRLTGMIAAFLGTLIILSNLYRKLLAVLSLPIIMLIGYVCFTLWLPSIKTVDELGFKLSKYDNFDIIFHQDWDHWAITETLPVEYETYHADLYPKGRPMMNQDFNRAGGIWRDSDRGWNNTQAIAGGANIENPERFTRTWRDSIVLNPVSGSPSFNISPRYNTGLAWAVPNTGDVNTYSAGEAAKIPLSQEYREIFLTYEWTLTDGMLENKGGKIPGMNGGPHYDCCLPPTETQGFAYHLVFDEGGLNTYAYYYGQDKQTEFAGKQDWAQFQPVGNDGGLPFLYDANGMWQIRYDQGDRTYEITIRIVMNNGHSADGFVQGFVNGYLVHQLDGLQWTYNGWPTDGIDGHHISIFWGGQEPFQGVLRDEDMYIDNYWFWRPSDISTQVGYKPLQLMPEGTILSTPNDVE